RRISCCALPHQEIFRERNRLSAVHAPLGAKRISRSWILRACRTSIPPLHRDAGVYMDMSDTRFLWLLVVGAHFAGRTQLLDCSVTSVVFRYLDGSYTRGCDSCAYFGSLGAQVVDSCCCAAECFLCTY